MFIALSGITQRVIAVDAELGVASLRMDFGPGSLFNGKGELDVRNWFKITGGLIRAAETFCKQMPPATKSGWEKKRIAELLRTDRETRN
jgi:hypothetical protein